MADNESSRQIGDCSHGKTSNGDLIGYLPIINCFMRWNSIYNTFPGIIGNEKGYHKIRRCWQQVALIMIDTHQFVKQKDTLVKYDVILDDRM